MFNGRFLFAAVILLAIGEAAILMVFGDASITTLGGYAKYSLWIAGIGTAVLLLFHQKKTVGLTFGGAAVAAAVLFKTAVAVRALASGLSRWWGSDRVQLVWAQLREDTLILGLFSLIVACLGWYVFVFTFPAQSEKVTDKIKEVYSSITDFLVKTPPAPALSNARVASSPTVHASAQAKQIIMDDFLATLLQQGLVTPPATPPVQQKACPLCSHKTDVSARFCPSCGFNYTAAASISKTERVSLVCQHCRSVAARPGKVCATCGKSLLASAQPAVKTPTHCSGCNDKLEPGAEWCVTCGKKVT